jgi:hypothetical protein
VHKELEEKLARRWPGWFDLAGTLMTSAMARRLACGDGWFEVVWRLCVDLEPMVTELEKEAGQRFEAMQVKEKLGALRFYVSHHTDAIDERIVEAQKESSRTCAACGQPGRQREVRGWVRAVCDEHAEGSGGLAANHGE